MSETRKYRKFTAQQKAESVAVIRDSSQNVHPKLTKRQWRSTVSALS